MLVEQVGVEVRELDRVLDQLDLVVEAADVVVGDVGDLFEHELLDLGPRQALERAGPERPSMSRWSPARSFSPISASASSHTRSSSARPTTSARVPSSSSSLSIDDLAGDLGAAGEHDVERLVEHDLLAALRCPRRSTSGCTATRILRPAREDVDGAVVVGAEERAVRRRRHRELLDLFAERGDVLARLAQGGREALVLGDGLGELALGLEEPLLERADPLGRVLEPAAEDDDLFLERLQLAPGARRPAARTRRGAARARKPLPTTSSESLSRTLRRTLHRGISCASRSTFARRSA